MYLERFILRSPRNPEPAPRRPESHRRRPARQSGRARIREELTGGLFRLAGVAEMF